MVIADKSSLPVSIVVASASPHEVTLAQETLAFRFTRAAPVYLVGDRAYDSDSLDKELKPLTIMIAPHRSNRVRKKTQDGRQLRRMKRRWKVERLNAWLQSFRSITTRFAYYFENYRALVLLGCMLILLRYY